MQRIGESGSFPQMNSTEVEGQIVAVVPVKPSAGPEVTVPEVRGQQPSEPGDVIFEILLFLNVSGQEEPD